MAFDGLSSRLQEITRKLKGKARITEDDLKEVLREVKLALSNFSQYSNNARSPFALTFARTSSTAPSTFAGVSTLQSISSFVMFAEFSILIIF